VAGFHPDVELYHRVGSAVAAGQGPYEGAPLEYPPMAIVAMIVPSLAEPAGFEAYARLWAVQAAILAVAVALGIAWLARRPGSLVAPDQAVLGWAALVACLAPVVVWRFDLVAVALSVVAVGLTVGGRPGWAGFALGLGALVKVFPGAFVPVLVAWTWYRGDRRGAARSLLACAVTAGLVMSAAMVLFGVEPVLYFIHYQADRLIQIESLASSVLLLAHLVAEVPVVVVSGFGSIQIDGPGTDGFLALSNLVLVVAVVAAWAVTITRFRAESRAPGGPSLATLVVGLVVVGLAVVLANKVLSAQFVLWVLPLVCLLPGRMLAVAVGAGVLTTVVFPLLYAQLADLDALPILALVSRNGLLIWLLAWLVIRPPTAPVRRQESAEAVSDLTS
jgi:hypothetical protein